MLSNENHIWFHKQSPQAQGYLNAIFQEYKRQVDACSEECKVQFVDDLDMPYEVKPVEFSIDERGKYNRAEKKREDKELIREWEEER